jgi:hypothetical protein
MEHYQLLLPFFDLAVCRLCELMADDEGQSETTEMLIRISLALAIMLVVGGLLYVAITQLGQRVSGDINSASGWGG